MSWTAETNIKGPKGDKGDQGDPGLAGAGTGDVIGPAGAVADRIAVYNGATGKLIKDGGKLISELGSGTASGIAFTPAGNIAATNVQAALVELDNEKVAKAGDTMTGNLIVSKSNPSLVLQKTASGQANQVAGYNSANARWSLALGDSTAESGSNAGSNFVLYSYTDAGGALAAPLTIARADGGVTLTGPLVLAADPGVALGAATKQYVDNKTSTSAVGFDPSTTTSVTLSNGNLTATHAAAINNAGARVAGSMTAGKYYFEVKSVVKATGDAVGLCAPGNTYNQVLTTNATVALVVLSSGNVNVATTLIGTIGAFVANDVAGIAVDIGMGLVWIRRNAGTWNGSGAANPATGVGGAAFAVGTALAPVVAFATGAGAESCIANFGATAFAFAAPAGFTNWGAVSAVRYDAAQGLTANQMAQGRANIGAVRKNFLINGAFTIQQDTAYVSGAVLASGAYGHDQWKAGAGGGDYTFTQLKGSTTITIAAGKSLIQPIEDVRVTGGGSYVLAWTGTAQARAGVNTLTPSGSYAASPLLITGQTDGTVMSVEFNAGTLGNVGLYEGNVAPLFQAPDYATELAVCERYWRKTSFGSSMAFSATQVRVMLAHADMRVAPTVLTRAVVNITDITTTNPVQSAIGSSVYNNTPDSGMYDLPNFSGLTVGKFYFLLPNSAPILLSARL